MTKRRKESKDTFSEMAQKALNEAFADLVRETRKTRGSLVIWHNNRVTHMPASKIPIPRMTN